MIRLVTGPPGAGKTTHITEHKKPEDLVIDYDSLRAFSASDTTARRLQALLESKASEFEGDVWIARTLPNVADRESFVDRVKVDEVITLDVSADEAKRRVLERDGNEELFPAIDRWFEKNLPDKGTESKESFMSEENTNNEVATPNDVASKVEYPNGFPADTPLVEMSVDEREAYWKFHSRKHEKNANELSEQLKANEADAQAWRDYQASLNDPVADAKREAQEEVFKARIELAAARSNVDLSPIMKHLDMGSFMGEDGAVDNELINGFVQELPSGTPQKPSGLPDVVGSNEPLPKASGLEIGKELYASMHNK